MQDTLRDWLTVVVGVLGLTWYYFSLLAIGLRPLNPGDKADTFREFMSLSVTTIGVSLATFVGMLLGVREVGQQLVTLLRDTDGQAALLAAARPAWASPADWISDLQWIAAGLYVLSLVIALVLWRRGGDATDPAISNLGKSLLGLIAGALAIALNLSR